MPFVIYSSNPATWTAHPGLYLSERNPPSLLPATTLNKVGVCGECVRGPVAKVIEITSEARFLAIFGGRDRGNGGTYAGLVHKSLLNKKFGTVAVARAAASDAVAASKVLTIAGPTTIVTVTAANVGAWGLDLQVAVENASDAVGTHFNLVVTYLGATYTLKNLNVNGASDNNLAAVLATVWPDADERLITLTKNANGRPDNAVAAALTSGSDGTILDADFTGTDDAIEKISRYAGLKAIWVAERAHTAAIKNKLETEAASATDRVFLMGTQDETVSIANAKTDKADYVNGDGRIGYVVNFPKTIDPSNATEIQVRGESWVASYIAQTDADIHPIDKDNRELFAGISDLYSTSLTLADYQDLYANGIMAWRRDDDGSFELANGRTTSTTSGKEELVRRRIVDELLRGLGNIAKDYVGKKGTASNERTRFAAYSDYLSSLKDAERLVEDFATPENASSNAEKAAGLFKDLVRVTTMGHILHLVIDSEMGTGVVVSEQQSGS